MTSGHMPGYGPPHLPPMAETRFGPRRRLLAVMIALALASGIQVLLASGGGWSTLFPSGSFKGSPQRPGWTIYEARRDGWSVEFPSSWYARRIEDVHRGSPYTSRVQSLAITNVDRGLKRAACGKNCWSFQVENVGLPSNGILVQIGWSYGGGFTCTANHDTPLPLSLTFADRTLTGTGAGGTPQLKLSTRFIVHGSPYYSAIAWIGSQATKSDLAALDRIVASIDYDAVDPAPPDPTRC